MNPRYPKFETPDIPSGQAMWILEIGAHIALSPLIAENNIFFSSDTAPIDALK